LFLPYSAISKKHDTLQFFIVEKEVFRPNATIFAKEVRIEVRIITAREKIEKIRKR